VADKCGPTISLYIQREACQANPFISHNPLMFPCRPHRGTSCKRAAASPLSRVPRRAVNSDTPARVSWEVVTRCLVTETRRGHLQMGPAWVGAFGRWLAQAGPAMLDRGACGGADSTQFA